VPKLQNTERWNSLQQNTRPQWLPSDGDAVCFALKNYDGPDPINVGVGNDITIADLALLIARVVGFTGAIRFDATHPDGTPRKLLDVSKLANLGWTAQIGLEEGVASTYRWFCDHGPAL
jgi:GDP-L-fucose synthase